MSLMGNREFRAIAVAETLSVVGDQLSRVALALLVFERTRSAGLSGLTYALTYLPTVAGGFLLSPLADRRPRREVSITIDAVRAAIVLAMAVPGAPFGALCCLVAVSSFLSGPYTAARLALLRDVLPHEQYGAGMAVRQSLSQGGQLVGFCVGGFIATAFDPAICLVVDGLTFGAAALVVRLFVRSRPPVATASAAGSAASTFGFIWRSPARRAILLSTVTGVFLTAPKALAAPLVFELGLGGGWAGLFMASEGLFSVVALAVFARYVTPDRYARIFPVACLAPCVPLLPVFTASDPLLIILAFGFSGALWAVLTVVAASSFVDLLPGDQRGRGMGIAGSMNATAQGVGAFLAGVAADRFGAGRSISLLGLAGILFALLPAFLWRSAPVADGQLNGVQVSTTRSRTDS
ncbi:MFS transporter [Streptomyces sp. NPDC005263]|uniref:MFS transporter n=1 Tax=Streptomyces sp. NPDC005263 TaxID=3364711 RepID=UPI00367CCDA2